jgi:hypothetical protein
MDKTAAQSLCKLGYITTHQHILGLHCNWERLTCDVRVMTWEEWNVMAVSPKVPKGRVTGNRMEVGTCRIEHIIC